jgi:hypothetical protein
MIKIDTNCSFLFTINDLVFKRQYFFLIVFLFIYTSVNAQYQAPGDTINSELKVVPSADSIFKKPDTSAHNMDEAVSRYQDSLFHVSYEQNKNPKKVKTKHVSKIDTTQYSPKKAALLALACPGLGQIYMKKYWKLPIVYGVMGTVIYFVAANAQRLKEFNGYIRNSYSNIPNPAPFDQLDISQLETNRDYYRRNVQLASFGTMFAWGLSIIDAVVDAHLHAFDINDKLSMKLKPQINSFDNSYYTGIAVNLTFK